MAQANKARSVNLRLSADASDKLIDLCSLGIPPMGSSAWLRAMIYREHDILARRREEDTGRELLRARRRVLAKVGKKKPEVFISPYLPGHGTHCPREHKREDCTDMTQLERHEFESQASADAFGFKMLHTHWSGELRK